MDEPKTVLRETDDAAIRQAKTILRLARHGALAVLDPHTGAPLASRVGVATDLDGSPIILVSMLSAHTRALMADARCCLLLGETGKGDPLAHPRISISCNARQATVGDSHHARLQRRYLNRNPKASLYAGLGDFHYFRLSMLGASFNGGFGRAYSLTTENMESPTNPDFEASEQGAIDHMNSDHREAIALYARHYATSDDDGWTLSGIDAEGMDLLAGDRTARVWFEAKVPNFKELRSILVNMAALARQPRVEK